MSARGLFWVAWAAATVAVWGWAAVTVWKWFVGR
jgi:hypothetical protein